MFFAVLIGLGILGAAVWTVLNQSLARNRRRNVVISACLLSAGGLLTATALIGALVGWF